MRSAFLQPRDAVVWVLVLLVACTHRPRSTENVLSMPPTAGAESSPDIRAEQRPRTLDDLNKLLAQQRFQGASVAKLRSVLGGRVVSEAYENLDGSGKMMVYFLLPDSLVIPVLVDLFGRVLGEPAVVSTPYWPGRDSNGMIRGDIQLELLPPGGGTVSSAPATEPATVSRVDPMSRYAPLAQIEIGWVEAMPACDAYFTWKDQHKTRVLFYWMDQPVGRGQEGFDRILANAEKLPEGSRLLIYPMELHRMDVQDLMHIQEAGSWWIPPWGENGDRLFEIARKRHLTLIYSPRDRSGRPRPESLGVGYLESSEADRALFPE